MPIAKVAIEKYLQRKIEPKTWFKSLLPLEVEEELANIKPAPKFTAPLFLHQKICFLMGIAYPETIFMTDLGTGKSAISLELLSYFYHNNFIRRAFIFVPTNEVAEGWEDEIKRWGFTIPFIRLTQHSSEAKWEALSEFGDGLIIGTYIGIASMASELVQIDPTKQKRERIPQQDLLEKLFKGADAVVYDQCFPKGTLIETSIGEVPIEFLKEGDLVLSSDLEFRNVETAHHKYNNFLCEVYLDTGKIIRVTPDHPFFTNLGWVCAKDLNGKYLYDKTSLQHLWKNISKTTKSCSKGKKRNYSTTEILQQILLVELEGVSNISTESRDFNVGAPFWKAELEQRYPSLRRDKKKIKRSSYNFWSYFQIPWWKRHRTSKIASIIEDYTKSRLDCGIPHFIKAEATRLSNLLQSGFWKSNNKDCNRNRWWVSQQLQTKGSRSKKRFEAEGIRVERVKIIKYDSPQDVYTLTVRECPHYFAEGVLVHNSTKLGNTVSLSFQVCKYISERAQIRFSLAGRAFGRDPFVLWSQFYLTDHGKALGNKSTIFRAAFWRAEKTPWGVPKWMFRKRREKQLSHFITQSSIRFSIDECLQLPPKVNIIKECTFPDENWAYYDQIREELLKSHGNYIECKNAFLRLRQLSSGFIGFKDEESGDKAQIEFAVNPKLDLLMELLEEVPEDKKIIIFHEFNWSGSRICQQLTKAKYKYGWLWGGTTDWTRIKNSFNEDDDFRVLVANWKKASMGLNLQSASYMFFFESPVSAIDRYECEGRIYRTGQNERTFIYDLVLRDSADEAILGFHETGKNLWKALVENPAKLLNQKVRNLK